MFKRIFLYLLTNIAILVVISILLALFNVQPYLTQQGIDYASLMAFSLIVGFTGSTMSLLLSKFMAKRAFNIQIIAQPSSPQQSWLINTVQRLAQQSNVGMPEVGVYDSPEANAFATGWNRNQALVAVSTALLNGMSEEEIEAVLAHEISHIANGDMVTMTLVQGVVNTFVIFLSRIAALAVAQFLQRGRGGKDNAISHLAYYGLAIVFQIVFGLLASLIVMWFSRWREFRADKGSAKLVGSGKMIKALEKLQAMMASPQDKRGHAFTAMKISPHEKHWFSLFASHPPISKRIQALQSIVQ